MVFLIAVLIAGWLFVMSFISKNVGRRRYYLIAGIVAATVIILIAIYLWVALLPLFEACSQGACL